MSAIADRLAALGVTLPKPAAPVANYVGAVRTGGLVVVSGQLPSAPTASSTRPYRQAQARRAARRRQGRRPIRRHQRARASPGRRRRSR